MSTTYHLCCMDCKQRIWVGQRGGGSKESWIYKDGKTLDKLESFLVEHEDHRLKYASEYAEEGGDYNE